MPDYEILNENQLQDKIFDIQLGFQQELLTVKGITSTKPILLTSSVATCAVCIIYDSITKFTLFSHIDESIDIEKSQTELLFKLREENININNIKVFIAGGRQSQPSSRAHAKSLEQFWQKKIAKEHLNTELLLARDCFSFGIDEAWAYLKKKVSPEELNNISAYIADIRENQIDPSYLYISQKRDGGIAKKIGNLFIDLCKEKELIKENSYPLIGIQVVKDASGAKVLVDLQIPERSYFPVIGFDTRTGKMFIVNSPCIQLLESVIKDLGLEERYNTSISSNSSHELVHLKDVIDAYHGRNKYQTSSPLPTLTDAYMQQHDMYNHPRYNDIFYMPTTKLKKDVRDILGVDRRKLTHISFDQLSFLREKINGITIEIDNTDSKSLNALVTFPASSENLALITSVIENWAEIKADKMSESDKVRVVKHTI